MIAPDLLLASALLLAAVPPAPTPATFEAEWREWHGKRLASLQRPQGWLALTGLHWLKEGENRIAGLPGAFTVAGGKVTLAAAAADGWTLGGAPLTSRVLASDREGKADRIEVGSRAAQVIDRGGKLALRVWDAERAERKAFTGIDTFPVDPRWRVVARWEPYATPREVEVPSVVGIPTREQAPGRAWFTVAGKEYALEPTLDGDELFFVFRDQTAPRETYGAGRFLTAAAPKDGTVVLDFNRATNPPCAFTPYATCPLPLPQNVLPVRIEAGEKSWGHR
jgi:uncharacterized protein (DUF1684 family)